MIDGDKVTISFKGRSFKAPKGSNLRKELLKNKLSPYNGSSNYLNCKGMGTCGTCAVVVKGEVNGKTRVEKWRLNFPPHQEKMGLRLACQITVNASLKLQKHPGFWGHKKP